MQGYINKWHTDAQKTGNLVWCVEQDLGHTYFVGCKQQPFLIHLIAF